MAASSNTSWWQPAAGTTWQISLLSVISPANLPNVTVVDADLFDNNATWSSVKSAGYKTICYFSAGSYEDWRVDKSSFLPADIGAPLEGWEGENWLDTRSTNVRKVMTTRMDLAKNHDCDAIDPDNMDVYGNGGGGFGLKEDDAVDYITFLADEAHRRGMAIGLKNALSIIPRVLDKVDFQVNEQCLQFGECDQVRPFIDAGKPVFEIEYRKGDISGDELKKVCDDPSRAGFSTVVKHMDLTTYGFGCRSSLSEDNDQLWTNLDVKTSGNSSLATTSHSSSNAPDNAGHIRSIPVLLMAGLAAVSALMYC